MNYSCITKQTSLELNKIPFKSMMYNFPSSIFCVDKVP